MEAIVVGRYAKLNVLMPPGVKPLNITSTLPLCARQWENNSAHKFRVI